MNTDSRRTYVRPLITEVFFSAVVLQSASPVPDPPVVPVDPEVGGGGYLSKKIEFDIWKDEEEDTSTKTFKFDWRKISTH
jgi:hypothetical protein